MCTFLKTSLSAIMCNNELLSSPNELQHRQSEYKTIRSLYKQNPSCTMKQINCCSYKSSTASMIATYCKLYATSFFCNRLQDETSNHNQLASTLPVSVEHDSKGTGGHPSLVVHSLPPEWGSPLLHTTPLVDWQTNSKELHWLSLNKQ